MRETIDGMIVFYSVWTWRPGDSAEADLSWNGNPGWIHSSTADSGLGCQSGGWKGRLGDVTHLSWSDGQ